MSASEIKLGEAFVSIGANIEPLTSKIKTAAAVVNEFGNKIMSIGKTASMYWAAKAAAVIGVTKHFAAAGDKLDKMALRTGIASQALSEMDFALSQCGSNLETFEAGIRKMLDSLIKTPDKFREIGLSVAELQNLNPEKQFYAIATAVQGIEDPARQTAAVINMFGEAGLKLLPLIKNGVLGTESLRQLGRQLGIVMTKEDTDKAAAMTDAYDKLQRSIKNLSVSIGGIFADTMIYYVDLSTRVVQWTNEATKSHGTLIKVMSGAFSVFSGLAISTLLFGTAIKTVGVMINWIAGGFHSFSSGMKSFGSSIKALGGFVAPLKTAYSEAFAVMSMSMADYAKYLAQAKIYAFTYDAQLKSHIAISKASIASEMLLNSLGIQRQSVLTKNCAQILLTSRAELAATIQKKASAAWNQFLYGSELQLTGAKTLQSQSTLALAAATIRENVVKVASMSLTSARIVLEGAFNALLFLREKLIYQNIFATIADTKAWVMHTAAIVVSKTATAIATVATYGLAAGVIALNAAIAICPIGWAIAGIAALGAAVYGVIYYFIGGETAAEKYAKKMHQVREENDKVRESHSKTIDLLEQLNKKEALSQTEQEQVSKAVEQLNSSYTGLNLTVDKTTGKIDNASAALRDTKKAVAEFKTADINNELGATKARMNELAESLAYGTTGWIRWSQAWATFGYVDTNDDAFSKLAPEEKIKEIERLLEEGSAGWANWWGGFFGANGGKNSTEELKKELKRLRDEARNLENEKIQIEIESVVNFSDNFKDAEKELNEILEKDRRAKMSQSDIKTEDIQKDFANRKKKLELLIQEAEEYQKLGALSKQQEEDLKNRNALLEQLNAEEKVRIDALYGEQVAEAKLKLEEMDKNQAEEGMSETEKKIAKIKEETKERKKLLDLYIESADKQKDLNAEQKKELQRQIEARAALADVEKARIQAVQDAQAKALQEEKDAQIKSEEEKKAEQLAEIDKSFKSKRDAERFKELEKLWKQQNETAPEKAKVVADINVEALSSNVKEEYEVLRNLVRDGASDQEKSVQKEKIDQMENELSVWRQRKEDLAVNKLQTAQSSSFSNPSIILAGTLDAQRKFYENQQANKTKNPLEEKADRQLDVQGKILTAVLDFAGGLFGV